MAEIPQTISSHVADAGRMISSKARARRAGMHSMHGGTGARARLRLTARQPTASTPPASAAAPHDECYPNLEA